MTRLRAFLSGSPMLAAWIVALALAMRVLIPAGFMPVVAAGGVTITLCTGMGPGPMPHTMAMSGHHAVPPAGQNHDHEQSRTDAPCAFAGLALLSLGAVDALLLAAAIGFVLALRRYLAAPRPHISARRLRPPSRGPPAFV